MSWSKVYTLEGITDFYADDDFEDAIREVTGDNEDLSVQIRITVELESEAATLRADNARLRKALKALMSTYDERGYPNCTQEKNRLAQEAARRVLEETSHADN